MDIKEKFKSVKEKAKKLEWKKLISTRAFITVGCVMLVCVAVLVSSLVDKSSLSTLDQGENRVLGNAVLVDFENHSENSDEQSEDPSANTGNTTNSSDFFAMAIMNRTQVRDSALEVLREIAENPDTLPDAKEEALSSIASIASDMSMEANIETLIEAKGISKCVAVISGRSCSVIVNTEELIPDELTQITDIIVEQTGIPVANITVVEAKK